MARYIKGDIFKSPAKIIVNTVNTDGVMGKGIALQCKNRYPEMFDAYKELCDSQCFDVGNLALWRGQERDVLLFPTKKHWRNSSKISYIESGLEKFIETWDKFNANTIAFPKLGCGNGGLSWTEVQPIMENYLKRIPMQVTVYVDVYEDTNHDEFQSTEIERCASGEYGTSGYEKFRIQLRNQICKLPVYEVDSKRHLLEEKNGSLFIDEKCITEEQLCDFWNWIRDTGVFKEEEIPARFSDFSDVFLYLMRGFNYISRIYISDNGFDFPQKSNGYQYNVEAY